MVVYSRHTVEVVMPKHNQVQVRPTLLCPLIQCITLQDLRRNEDFWFIKLRLEMCAFNTAAPPDMPPRTRP